MKCSQCPCENINVKCIYENIPYVCDLIGGGSRDDLKELALRECRNGDGLIKIDRGPSLTQKAINYTSSIFNHLLTGMQHVADDVKRERVKICESCEEYFDSEKRVCNHQDCGCPIDKKTEWASENCPIGKWASVDVLGKDCGGCGSKKIAPQE